MALLRFVIVFLMPMTYFRSIKQTVIDESIVHTKPLSDFIQGSHGHVP